MDDAPPDAAEELGRLRRALRRTEGFRFYSVAVDDPRGADAVLDALGAAGWSLHRVRWEHSARLDLALHSALLAERLLAPLVEPARVPAAAAVVALDVSNALPGDEAAWHWLFERLNERRNRVAATLARPLLLVGTPAALRWFTDSAPDFWSVLSSHFECATPAAVTLDAPVRLSSSREVEAALREADRATASADERASPEARAATLRDVFELHAAASDAMPSNPLLREAAVRAGVAAAEALLDVRSAEAALAAIERVASLAADAPAALRHEAWRALAALHERRGDITRAARFRSRADAEGPATGATRAAPAFDGSPEAPAPNGPYRRAAWVDRAALLREVESCLWQVRVPVVLVGVHGCGKSWLLERALDGRTRRRVHVDLGALPAAPKAFLEGFAVAVARSLGAAPARAPGEFADEWIERMLGEALSEGEVVATFDADIELLTTPVWQATEGYLRSWVDRAFTPPWGELRVALCMSSTAPALRGGMSSSGFRGFVSVGKLAADEVDALVARFGLPLDDADVRAALRATGGDVGPLVASLHGLARADLPAESATDPTRNPALGEALAPLRRWLDAPRRMQVFRAIVARPGVQLQGDAARVAEALAAAGLVESELGGWRVRRDVYTSLAGTSPP